MGIFRVFYFIFLATHSLGVLLQPIYQMTEKATGLGVGTTGESSVTM